MSSNTFNSDTSSNDDGTLSKYSDSQRSSGMNFKNNYDSGMGTSVSSSNQNDQITLKNLNLLEELKTLLKVNKSSSFLNESSRDKAQSSTSSMETQYGSERNQNTTHIDSTSKSFINNDMSKSNSSNFNMNDSANNKDCVFDHQAASSCSEISSASHKNRNSHDIDTVLYKTIQYIKKLQKISNCSNERASDSNSSALQKDINKNLRDRLLSASPLSITGSSMTNSSQTSSNHLNQASKSNTNSNRTCDNSSSNAKTDSNGSTMSTLSSSNSNNVEKNLTQNIENTTEKRVTTNNLSQILRAKINKNEDMCISIMVKTGLIFYVDDKLTSLLGHSFETWIEKRPIDFIYKHDISLFLTRLCELNNQINSGTKNISEIEIEPFYLRFRKFTKKSRESSTKSMSDESHTGILMDNQSNSDKSDQSSEVMLKFKCDADEFIAFKVELKADKVEFKTREGNFQNMDEEDQNLKTRLNHSSKRNEKSSNIETCIFLKLSTPIIAYHQELDHYTERSFITEHNVELEFIRVENKVTELLGYLPQDLERRSFLKFIHPDDLNKIKQIHFDIYEGRERQNLEVYRWKCYNGYYVPVKTNWSWYIHPWKQRIDFIIGKHVILNEPLNINIFEKNIIKAESGLNIFTNENSNEHLKQTQKNIVDYISKKIPGMDDAAKLLGEDLVKLLKKKYLSASYCQEQNRLLKRNNKDKSFELKTSQQEFEYPQYYVPTHKILQFKPDYNRFVEPKLPFLSSKQNSDKKSHTTIPPIYQTSRPQNSKSSMPALNSNKHGKERKSAIRQLKEKDNQIEQPYSYLSNSDTVNTSSSHLKPSPFNDRSFLTQYTICKYIDDLPKTWESDFEKSEEKYDIQEKLSGKRPITSDDNSDDECAKVNNSESMNFENSKKIKLVSDDEITETNIRNKRYLDEKVIDYLLNNEKTPLDHNILQQDADIIFKKSNSHSSKSHSKIVLIDENDNFDEDDIVKPQTQFELKEEQHGCFSGEMNDEIRILESSSTENSFVNTAMNSSESVRSSNNYTALTKDALLKHTREQDEQYVKEILQKVRRPVKLFSKSPQNICAQTPNVFSKNEYEPPLKKQKQNPELKPIGLEDIRSGPYSTSINEIDCENPQDYHKDFYKKLESDNSPKTEKENNSGSDCSNNSNDILKFWNRFIRHGSELAKQLINAENHIKDAIDNKKNDPSDLKELKKKLISIANLLGINTEVLIENDSIDSNNSDVIDTPIKKLYYNLNSSGSSGQSQNLSPHNEDEFEINSYESMQYILDCLKNKFLNQFERFNKSDYNSSKNLNDTSNSNSNNSSSNPKEKTKSPNDFECSSADDSSTYLYDSTTSSFESGENLSNVHSLNTNKNKKPINNKIDQNIKDSSSNNSSEYSNPHSKSSHFEFDDGLCVKLMQNYVDLFKKKSTEDTSEFNYNDSTRFSSLPKNESFCSRNESENVNIKSNCQFSSDSTSSLANKMDTSDEECGKNLYSNIYDDCLRSFSGLDNENDTELN